MASFKPTHTRSYAKAGQKVTSDTLYWRNLEFPVTVKEYTAIDYIDISSTEPHYIAVTAGPKVDIYHQQTAQVWRTLSRFQHPAYGGTFRQDGQLLVAGCDNGKVMLYNYRQKQLLRTFKGHEGAVHRAKFVSGSPRVVSFSDDKSVALWDMTDEMKICTMTDHTDFIRAGAVSPASEHIVLSGSYDHTVKMWDTRTANSVLTVDHEAPVSSIVCYPSGNVFVSAGGNEIRVWDAISKRLLAKLSQHHKAITCLAMASDNRRLMSGSLDRHVKIYDIDTYTVVHTMDYLAPVLSTAVAPGDSTVVVGMISSGAGMLSFQHRKHPDNTTAKLSKKKAANIRNTITEDFKVTPGDQVVEHVAKDKLSHYDAMLRKFEYSRTLDVVLRDYVTRKSPHITVAVLQELIRRQGLKTAVAGRDAKTLTPLLRFIIRFIRDPKYKQVLLDVASCVLDIYGDTIGENPIILKLFRRLREEVETEIKLGREHMALMGAIQLFLTSSSPQKPQTAQPVSLMPLSTPNIQESLNSSTHNSDNKIIVEVT